MLLLKPESADDPVIGNWGLLTDAGEESMNEPNRAGEFAALGLKSISSLLDPDTDTSTHFENMFSVKSPTETRLHQAHQ